MLIADICDLMEAGRRMETTYVYVYGGGYVLGDERGLMRYVCISIGVRWGYGDG